MATRETVKAVVGSLAMVAVDLRSAFNDTQSSSMLVSVWFRALGSVPDDILTGACDLAVQRHRERNATPAHVLACVDEIMKRKTGFPSVGEIWQDIRDGYAAWGYHEGQVDFGGWAPKHGAATEYAVRLLGGWACIDRMIEDGMSGNISKSLTDRYETIREKAGAAIALPASTQAAIGADLSRLVGKIGEIGESDMEVKS